MYSSNIQTLLNQFVMKFNLSQSDKKRIKEQNYAYKLLSIKYKLYLHTDRVKYTRVRDPRVV